MSDLPRRKKLQYHRTSHDEHLLPKYFIPDRGNAIQVSDFSFGYAGNSDLTLKDINFTIKTGEFILLLGPSGCGKSTLCDALTGIIPHHVEGRMKGKIEIFGQDTWEHAIADISRFVGLVKQNPDDQLVTFTVRDEIAFGLENHRLPVELIHERIEEIAQMLNLTSLLDRDISQLSGGEKQRTVIASIMVLRPRILILDEPSAFLDYEGLIDLMRSIAEICKYHGDLTIILVDHRVGSFFPESTRLLFLSALGELTLDITPRDFLAFSPEKIRKVGIRLPFWMESHFGLDPPNNAQTRQPIGNDSAQPLFELRGVGFSYKNSQSLIPALREINLKIWAGEKIALTGPNGSGKTTLLYLLAGFLKPETGEILFRGRPITEYNTLEYARNVGFIFQNPESQIFRSRVDEEIKYAVQNFKIPAELWKDQYDLLCEKFEINYLQRNPYNLSWGQKRRINLASVLIYGPEIIMFDEPFIGQDEKKITALLDILTRLEEKKPKTMLFVSHDEHLLMRNVQKIIFIEEGRIQAMGKPRDLLPKIYPRGFVTPEQFQVAEGKKENPSNSQAGGIRQG